MILMNDKISESHEEKRIAVHLLPIACSFQRHCLGAFFLLSIRFIASVFIAYLKVPLLNANREPSMIFFKKIPYQCPYLCKITKVSFARSPSVRFFRYSPHHLTSSKSASCTLDIRPRGQRFRYPPRICKIQTEDPS